MDGEVGERLARIEGCLGELKRNQVKQDVVLVRVLAELKDRDAQQEQRLRTLEVGCAEKCGRVGVLAEDVQVLKRRGMVWDIANSMAAVGGYVVGLLKGQV